MGLVVRKRKWWFELEAAKGERNPDDPVKWLRPLLIHDMSSS